MIERSVTLELALKIALVILQLALLDGIDAVATEVDHLAEAADLGRHVRDVQTAIILLALLENVV